MVYVCKKKLFHHRWAQLVIFYSSASFVWIKNTEQLKIFSLFSNNFIEIITSFPNLEIWKCFWNTQNCATLRTKSIWPQLSLAFNKKKMQDITSFSELFFLTTDKMLLLFKVRLSFVIKTHSKSSMEFWINLLDFLSEYKNT